MKAVGRRYFVVRESIFRRTVHVFLNWSIEEFDRWAKRQSKTYQADPSYTKNFAAFSSAIESDLCPTEWIIFVRDFNWYIDSVGSLIHEIVHTIIKIWGSNNIPVTADTQEFLADAVSRLYEAVAAKILHLQRRKRV